MTIIQQVFLKKVIFLSLMVGVGFFLAQPLIQIFAHNFILNFIIIGCTFLGGGLSFYQLWRLNQEQHWLSRCEQGIQNFPNSPKTRLLTPLKILLEDPVYEKGLPSSTVQALLNSLEARLIEKRSTNRYLMGLLVFLGLLGTFWGLSETIGTIADVINNLNPKGVDAADSFNQLRQGIQSPLKGMGVAFSSSLFGLTGSLILGFLDLQLNQASSDFYHKLEEKLLLITKPQDMLSREMVVKGQSYNGPTYSLALLEQTIESMAALQTHLHRSEDNRLILVKSIQGLGDKLTQMAEQMVAHQSIIKTITHNQYELQERFKQLLQHQQTVLQTEANSLKGIDSTLTKILEEGIEGRNRLTQDLKQEIRVIARVLSALANDQEAAA